MEFIIRRLSNEETDVITAVCELLNESYDKGVSEYFIYRDKSYISYLTKNLESNRDFVYVVVNTADNALIGFAQVKQVISSIFLNNIIILPEFRGHNIASKLLYYIIRNFGSGVINIETFSLEVFERNSNVLNWYQRLGMKVSGVKYWYDLSDVINSEKSLPMLHDNDSGTISVTKDQNGFGQVYSGEVNIGTLISNKTLLMRSLPPIEVLGLLKEHFGYSLKGVCLVADKEFDYPLIDRSLKLEVSIEALSSNLNKLS